MTEPTLQAIAKSLDAYRAETASDFRHVHESIDALRETVMGLATHMDASIAESEQRMTGRITASEHRVMDHVDRKVDGSEARIIEKVNKNGEITERLIGTLEKKNILTVHDTHRIVTGK